MVLRLFKLSSLLVAVALVVAACWAWSQASPALGERSFTPARIWTARCGAIALWAAAHAVLAGIALPAIYRARPVYIGLAAFAGFASVLLGVSAAALLVASR